MKLKHSHLWLVAGIALLLDAFNSMVLGGTIKVGQANAATGFGIDDNNTAYVTPMYSVSALPQYAGTTGPGQCSWINSTLNGFDNTYNANPANAGTSQYAYTWAGATQEAAVQSAITTMDYYAWVVSEPGTGAATTNATNPTITTANGTSWPVDNDLKTSNGNKNDVGGAVLNVSYTPGAGNKNAVADSTTAAAANPLVTTGGYALSSVTLNWVQALQAHYDSPAYNGANPYYQYRLDNPFAAGATPFYNTGGAAGLYGAGNASTYFLDTPYKVENEAAERNPVANVQFQLVIATDSIFTKAGAATINLVTLYGGFGWGYNYTAADVPAAPAPPAGFASGNLPSDTSIATSKSGLYDGSGVGLPYETGYEAIPVPLPATAGVGFSILAGFGALSAVTKRLRRTRRIAA